MNKALIYLFCLTTFLIACDDEEVVSDICKCSSTYTLYQDSSSYVFLPNIFTPDFNGNNDVFQLIGNNILNFNLTIYDGQNVITTINAQNQSWDGFISGQIPSCKNVTYDLNVILNNGVNLSYHDTVTVFTQVGQCPENKNDCYFEDQFITGFPTFEWAFYNCM